MERRIGALVIGVSLGWIACAGEDEIFGRRGYGGEGGAGGGSTTTSTDTTTTTTWTTSTTSSTTTSSGTTSTTTGTGTTSTTTTTSGGGGEGGADPCPPPSHLCGSYCAGNTPSTGCYTSVDCEPCAAVAHAQIACTSYGQCTHTCVSPYVPSGGACVCPTQCCEPADCVAPATCTNGQCVGACDAVTCMFDCMLQGYTTGECNTQGQCVCQ